MRISWITSLSVMASLSTGTAIRSTTTALAETASNRPAMIRMLISERLSDGKEELQMADILQNPFGRSWIVEQQLLVSALQPHEARRVDTVRQIQPDRTYGRPVANAEPGGVDHVIKVRQALLAYPKRDFSGT